MELYRKLMCCFCSIRYLLLIGIHVLVSDAKLYSEDDVYTTNFTTTYSNIPSNCSLFGRKFETDYFDTEQILNTNESGIYWVGAKIGFQRNINPLGVLDVCNATYKGSLDDCNRHCKGWKYFSYNEQSCSCSNNEHTDYDLKLTEKCEKTENDICSIRGGCVVYERDVLKEDYLCGVYYYYQYVGWVFSTQNCSFKYNFACEGDNIQSDAIKSSWLEAENFCWKKGKNLVQTLKKSQFTNDSTTFIDGTGCWVSLFRRKKIFWGVDFTNTVCVAATVLTNGSYRLESHFCNESLEALCHKPDRTNYGSSKSEIVTASLGTALGGVLVCITVVAVIKNRRY